MVLLLVGYSLFFLFVFFLLLVGRWKNKFIPLSVEHETNMQKTPAVQSCRKMHAG